MSHDLLTPETRKHSHRVLTCNGFSASLMKAPKLPDDGKLHGLPSGDPIPALRVDEFPGCPSEWTKGEGSYFCVVEPDWGLWYSWTSNNNIAIIPSTQGANPVDGRKSTITMEQYKECPVHNQAFIGNRICEACTESVGIEFSWPYQNYVSSPNTLWWDGWRVKGEVRQFVFTEKEEEIVANVLVGKENVMPAFGFAMFEMKNPPPAPVYRARGLAKSASPHVYNMMSADDDYFLGAESLESFGAEIASTSLDTNTVRAASGPSRRGRRMRSSSATRSLGCGATALASIRS